MHEFTGGASFQASDRPAPEAGAPVVPGDWGDPRNWAAPPGAAPPVPDSCGVLVFTSETTGNLPGSG